MGKLSEGQVERKDEWGQLVDSSKALVSRVETLIKEGKLPETGNRGPTFSGAKELLSWVMEGPGYYGNSKDDGSSEVGLGDKISNALAVLGIAYALPENENLMRARDAYNKAYNQHHEEMIRPE